MPPPPSKKNINPDPIDRTETGLLPEPLAAKEEANDTNKINQQEFVNHFPEKDKYENLYTKQIH